MKVSIVKSNKIVLFAIFLLFVLLTYGANVSSATIIGDLDYWYSNADYIGKYESTPELYYDKLNSNASFLFATGITQARTKWSSAGVTINSTSSSTEATGRIRVYGGTVAELDALGIFGTVSFSYNGLMSTTRDASPIGTYLYGNNQKDLYTYIKSNGYVVDKGRTSDQVKKTCLHELGHGIGWSGHSSNSNDIMYSYGSSVTNLTTRDINHITQIQ